MITFIITNEVNRNNFVASSRFTPEEQWQTFITQAYDGKEGQLFEQIREVGESHFKLEEWGFSDNANEIKQMMQEAQDDLHAIPVHSKRASSTEKKKVTPASLRDIEKMLQDIHNESTDWDEQDTPPTPTKGVGNEANAAASSPKSASQSETDSKPSGKRTQEVVEENPLPTRQTDSTDAADEMREVLMRIESRRQGMKKRPTPAKKRPAKATASKSALTGSSNNKASAKKANAPKLATGRSTSAEKERRIKEAIKLEKEQRDNKKQEQISAEADEMAALMAKLDARTKEVSKVKRKR